MHFLGILYLSPERVLRPEIFTPATVWPRLPSAHPSWDGGPPKKFRCEFGPSKMHFLGILYLSPEGVLRPEIFTPATVWPRLPSAHPSWDGGPPKNFNREN